MWGKQTLILGYQTEELDVRTHNAGRQKLMCGFSETAARGGISNVGFVVLAQIKYVGPDASLPD
jgi:hypothetical protein